jgi:uncharacterized membrane protein
VVTVSIIRAFRAGGHRVAGKSKKRIQSTGGRSKGAGNGGGDARDQVRADKRAQFESPGGGRRTGLILGGVALVAVVAVALVAAMSGGDKGPAAEAAPVAAAGDTVKIAMSEVSDGKAHFYSYDAGGTSVNYFVLKSSDGEMRAAFDACDVCYPAKKGYHQEGDEMVCNNCGRRFPSTKINVLEGGCNPSPLERTVEGDQLVLQVADLQAGASYFQ